MRIAFRQFAAATLVTIAALSSAPVRGDDNTHNQYMVNKLVSDLPGATVMDSNLKNPWGIAFSPGGGPFWVADNATGVSTVYNGDGSIVPLVVTIPGHSGSSSAGTPTGMIWNPSPAFLVPGTTIPAAFIFATEDGTISAWAPGLTPPNNAVLAADNSTAGAVYKGLTFGVNANGAFIYATNFHNGTVDVFDHNFHPMTTSGGFHDSNIPSGYAPFGIENINGDLFVSYAKQDAQKHDDVPGPGNGFVDIFDTDGNLLMNFASHGSLNSPWGMTRASFDFGPFSGSILIGNFGDGKVNVFDSQGHFNSALKRHDGMPLAINGLWKLTLGGGAKSSSDTLYFSAGKPMGCSAR
jgi:uncharacterized protein (TIGR03118 family)